MQDKKRGNMARIGNGERLLFTHFPVGPEAASTVVCGSVCQAVWLWNGVQEQGMLQAGCNRHFGAWL